MSIISVQGIVLPKRIPVPHDLPIHTSILFSYQNPLKLKRRDSTYRTKTKCKSHLRSFHLTSQLVRKKSYPSPKYFLINYYIVFLNALIFVYVWMNTMHTNWESYYTPTSLSTETGRKRRILVSHRSEARRSHLPSPHSSNTHTYMLFGAGHGKCQ